MLEKQLRTLAIHPPDDIEARGLVYWRTKTPAERIRAASTSADIVRAMITEELRSRNPDWPEMRVQHTLASVWLSDALKDEILSADDILAGKPEIRQRVIACVFGARSVKHCVDRV